MRLLFVLMFTLVQCDSFSNTTDGDCSNVKIPIGSVRKRRHLTFPEGSNMVLTISLVKAFMTHAPSGWNIALEIDVMFPLPEEKFTNRFFRRKQHHKEKREFWDKLRGAIDFHNMNGRGCILRSVCEAQTYLASPGKSLVHDILRVIFTAPIHEEEFREELKDYGLTESFSCEKENDCPFSLLDLALSLNKQ